MKELLLAIQNLLIYRRVAWRQVHFLLIFLAFGFAVIVDLLNGFLINVVHTDLSVGILFRGILMALFLGAFLYLKTSWTKFYFVALIVIWLVENTFWMETARGYSLPKEVAAFAKIIYPWVIYAYLAVVLPRYNIALEYPMRCLVFFGTVGGASIIFSYFTGYGIDTYERVEVFGVKSYFNSQNDIGLAMLLPLPMGLYLFERYGHWRYAIYSLVIAAGLALLGTRTGLLGACAALGAYLFFYVLGAVEKRKRSGKRILLIAIMLVTAVSVLAYTAASISEYRYLYSKYEELLEESPREDLEIAAHKHISRRSNLHNLVGEGSAFYLGVLKYYPGVTSGDLRATEFESGKAAEQDIYDMLGLYGLLLGGLILTVFTMLMVMMTIALALGRNLLLFTFFLANAFLVFHSFLAGHALGNAVVAAPAGLIYYFVIERIRLFMPNRLSSRTLPSTGIVS